MKCYYEEFANECCDICPDEVRIPCLRSRAAEIARADGMCDSIDITLPEEKPDVAIILSLDEIAEEEIIRIF